jgi:hypothetical protein
MDIIIPLTSRNICLSIGSRKYKYVLN